MGCGAHLLVVGAEQKDEQRLRKAVRDERSVHPGGDDTADGEAPGTQMRLFRRFHRNCPKSLGHAYNITLPATKMVLFGPLWHSYTGKIYGRSVALTPLQTVSRRNDLGNPHSPVILHQDREMLPP